MSYFASCKTVTEIKKLYRELAMQHHPDRGGDTATMQAINAQYHEALKRFDRQQETGSDGSQHTYYYNAEHEQSIMDKINELLKLRLEGVEIWLIGKWIWVQGDTKPHREALKNAALSWHSKRLAWYWKPYEERTRYNERMSLSGLADHYGAKLYEPEQEAQRRREDARSQQRPHRERAALNA